MNVQPVKNRGAFSLSYPFPQIWGKEGRGGGEPSKLHSFKNQDLEFSFHRGKLLALPPKEFKRGNSIASLKEHYNHGGPLLSINTQHSKEGQILHDLTHFFSAHSTSSGQNYMGTVTWWFCGYLVIWALVVNHFPLLKDATANGLGG